MITKRIIAVLLCVCMLMCMCSCTQSADSAIQNNDTKAENPTCGFEVHFIDVGQGDAALVLCGDKTMLIDGGKPQASDIIYTYLKKMKIDYLDYIVSSHADDDHIGGLSAPLATMNVGKVIAPEAGADTRSYQSFKSKIEEKNIEVIHPQPGTEMDFAESKIEFYGPITETSKSNNNSIVMKIIYGKTSFLFTGDAEREEEQDILQAGYDVSATVLKVGHHGSRYSTTYPFLRDVMPKYAVISVGADNYYGHPTEDTLSRLRDADVEVYRTDTQGDIIAKSDGKRVSITAEKKKNNKTYNAEQNSNSEQNADKKTGNEQSNTNAEYIGNKSTKKFHYPLCRFLPNEENREYLTSRQQAVNSGFVPCGVCKP